MCRCERSQSSAPAPTNTSTAPGQNNQAQTVKRLTNPEWKQEQHRGGEVGALSVDAQGLDGREVLFTMERRVGVGEWTVAGMAHGTVQRGKAQVDMPLDYSPPDLGRQPRAHDEALRDPQWKLTGSTHGDTAEMQVSAPNLDGKRVRFIVEKRQGRSPWTTVVERVAVVKDQLARATVVIEHPYHDEKGAGGKADAGPAHMRFKAELVQAPQPIHYRFQTRLAQRSDHVGQ